jgi:hypothetical protein
MSPSPSRHLAMCTRQLCAVFQTAPAELRPAEIVSKSMEEQRKPIRPA